MNHRRRKKLTRRLLDAIVVGDTAGVRAALRAGADPEHPDSEGATPLYLASVSGHAEIARLLLNAGARPDTESGGTGSEGTPLCAAACWGHIGAVRELLAHGADPDLREDQGTGRTALEWAREGGHTETVELLVTAIGAGTEAAGAEAAPGSSAGRTPGKSP
ncbi:ankyrin repeat domain-containing protein [Streptomyces thermospinosisporus]|uniref:Ankyrin repeat domain-containing protein n=1 Tax=Streptomyces thermospinosisporus TaxID=161482 RepID=A0ABP4JS01_9ACTN